MTILSHYDWIIAIMVILFPLGLLLGLMLRHRQRARQTQQPAIRK